MPCLFRIVQEGLRNVQKHSGADRWTPGPEREDGRVPQNITSWKPSPEEQFRLGTLRPEAGSDFDGFQVFPANPVLLISLTAVPCVTRVSPSCEGLDTEPNIGLSL